MIVNADTIVEPWAVMVESFDTPIANGAVSGPGSPQDETVRAHLAWMDLFEQL